MAAPKPDRRIQRTHKLLIDALFALSAEQGYDTVTIQDITDRANVAYVTFFRHFKDKHALLMYKVEDVIAEIDALSPTAQPNDTRPVHEREGHTIFMHAERHADFYRLIINSPARQQIQASLMKMLQGHLQPYALTIPGSLAVRLCANSLLGLIEWWLDHDMSPPPDRMAQIYYWFVVKPILAG